MKFTPWMLLCCLAFAASSCKKEKTEADLVKDMRKLDAFLRKTRFNYDSLNDYIKEVGSGFVHAEKKNTGYDAWTTSLEYRWNADSSATFVHAYKTYPKGFSRERIIHAGDSILFIHRFSTEPLGMQDRSYYTFLESVYYLAETGTIKQLARISYRETDLKDTLEFRKKPFADLTDNISHYYSLELSYARGLGE